MLANRMMMKAAAGAKGNDDYTKLLMHMDGTDDAQIFTDSSVGNLVKTGDAMVGTGYGVFDGVGDYLSIPNHADFAFADGNFCIEAWIRLNTLSVTQGITGQHDTVANKWFEFSFRSSGLYFYAKDNASGELVSFTQGSQAGWSINTWYHVAVVRNGSAWNMYRGGVSIASTTASGTMYDIPGAYPLSVGVAQLNFNNYYLNGYLDELRISNTARYTANFTPSRTPFTSDANTKLLIHFDLPETDPTVFLDSGPSDHTITANGNVFQKQDETGIIGTSCGYFDAVTGTYLTVADSSDFYFGTSSFCIEMWVKPLSFSNYPALFCHEEADYYPSHIIQIVSSSDLRWLIRNAAGADIIDFHATGLTLTNNWQHFAFVRSATNFYIYVDGVLKNSTTTSATIPKPVSTDLIVGGRVLYNYLLDGYLDELRISNVARYTANFTPPTTPFTSDANTKLLLHFDGGEGSTSFTDSGNTGHTVTANGNAIQVIGYGADAVGNVKTENTQYKFGETSAYFDGTGDYITLADSEDWDLFGDAGDATIDFWVKHDDHVGDEIYITQEEDANNFWQIQHEHVNGIRFVLKSGGTNIVDTGYASPITDSNWHHIALVKIATVYNIYKDGNLTDTVTDSSVDTFSGLVAIGNRPTQTQYLAGYIDELRISKGIARWTGNFTPPSAPYS